jgi:hypothetical protein
LKKLLEHKSVILAESGSLKKVRDYFYQFNLIETGEDFSFFLFGYPINQALNNTIKSKFKEL